MNMKYLNKAKAIREEIKRLFDSQNDKFAVVAFVGKDAPNYLPKRDNTTIICWPKAGGTNPDGVRALLKNGFNVKFCDNLHQKVYWCRDRGVIITSANLSDNALGDGGLDEFGVYIADNKFNLDAEVLKNLKSKPRAVTEKELDRLDIETNRFWRRNPKNGKTTVRIPTFDEWYNSKYRKKWKITWWYQESKKDENTTAEVEARFGVRTWKKSNDSDKDTFTEGDIVYQFKVDESCDCISRVNGCWFYVDMVTTSNKIVQVMPMNQSFIPFTMDNRFKKAFKAASNEFNYWEELHDKKMYPTTRLLKLLNDYYHAN